MANFVGFHTACVLFYPPKILPFPPKKKNNNNIDAGGTTGYVTQITWCLICTIDFVTKQDFQLLKTWNF